jgi:hypothetical protein
MTDVLHWMSRSTKNNGKRSGSAFFLGKQV